MKISALICICALIIFGVNAGVLALFGFDFLMLVCFNNLLLYRVAHIFCGVAALYIAFWVFAFKPFNNLS